MLFAKNRQKMFPNKKIIYIFVSLGDENAKILKKENKNSFFEKLKKRFSKKEKPILVDKNDIYQVLDKLISSISKYSEKKCFSFYLNQLDKHEKFIVDIQKEMADRYYVFPMYPQYNADLNQIANFFASNIADDILKNFFWIKSYAQHPLYSKAIQKSIRSIFKKNNLDEKETFFLFLAKTPVNHSELFYLESELTCQNIVKGFPYVEGALHFDDADTFKIASIKKRKNVIIIPISSLTDDYQTRNNLEDFKMLLEEKKHVFITHTLNQNSYFIRSVFDIIDEKNFVSNEMLLV